MRCFDSKGAILTDDVMNGEEEVADRKIHYWHELVALESRLLSNISDRQGKLNKICVILQNSTSLTNPSCMLPMIKT